VGGGHKQAERKKGRKEGIKKEESITGTTM